MIRWIRIYYQIGNNTLLPMINESVIHLALCGQGVKNKRLISQVSFVLGRCQRYT